MKWTITELLPNKREFIVLAVLLGIFYILTTIGITPERLPGNVPQVTIWVLYTILIILLILSLEKSKNFPGEPLQENMIFSWKPVFLFAILFTASSTLSLLVFGKWSKLAGGLVWICCLAAGIATFFLAVKFLCRNSSQRI